MIRAAACLLAASAVLTGCSSSSAPTPDPTTDSRPTAIVAMGDSEAAGVGGTAAATRAGGSAACARSDDGWLYQLTSIVDTRVDLACSGAKTTDVLNTGADRGTQPAQAAALATTASENRVTDVVVQVGANDAGFSSIVQTCVAAFLTAGGPSCQDQLTPTVDGRLATVTTGLDAALTAVRTVMRTAGYADDAYKLVVLSYGSPFSEKIDPATQTLAGCPLRTSDLAWLRTSAVPALSTAVQASATTAGADFLDLSTSMAGHEACTGGADASGEWQNRLSGPRGTGAAFHPTTPGYTRVATLLDPVLAG